jgi:hypothetical protein
MKAQRGSKGKPLIFNLGGRWGWVVNAMPRPFNPGKVSRYLLYRRLGGTQDRSERVRNISPPPEFDPQTVQLVASRYTAYTISAHELAVYYSN